MPAPFNVGPDGMVLVYALVVSIIIAVLSWRRVGLTATGAIVMAVAVAIAIANFFMLDPAGPTKQNVRASFIVVPTVMLLGASRVRSLARHAWVLVLLGPFVFVGCYVGICEAIHEFAASEAAR